MTARASHNNLTRGQLDTDPPEFRKDLGELEYLEEEMASKGAAADVDPDGLFAGF